MKELKLDDEVINDIKKKESKIGLKSVETKGTKAAIKGDAGFDVFSDYRRINMLSAYKPINILGLKWAVMSEIDEVEALTPIKKLKDEIIRNAITVGIIAVFIGGFLG